MTRVDLIRMLGLSPLPGEGGYFRQTWVSADRVPDGALGARYPGEKALGTAIYYLVTDDVGGFSAMHRLPTDEVYHFYLGDPVEQLLLHPDGPSEVVVLGQDVGAGQRVQHVAPRDTWQGTRLVHGRPGRERVMDGRDGRPYLTHGSGRARRPGGPSPSGIVINGHGRPGRPSLPDPWIR